MMLPTSSIADTGTPTDGVSCIRSILSQKQSRAGSVIFAPAPSGPNNNSAISYHSVKWDASAVML